jgi:nitrate reductase delta subunit
MTRSFKVLSLLLTYPTREIQDATTEMKEVLRNEAVVGERERRGLCRLIDELAQGDLYDMQERYVLLFDRTRTLSLHLFEHIHGESRDRGQAMVDLMAMYEGRGLTIDARELPDHLPLFLEFLSTLPLGEARDVLTQPLHIVEAVGERLKKRQSAYAHVFAALTAMARHKAPDDEVKALLDEPEHNPDDLDEMDRIWEAEAVTFGGGGENACGPDRLRTRIRAANRPAPDYAQGE